MDVHIDLQIASKQTTLPKQQQFMTWTKKSLEHQFDCQKQKTSNAVTIRIVDELESKTLNKRYRQKDSPTNVLSFPLELPNDIESSSLGDIVICAPVIAKEAKEQHKQEIAHWAHITIHGLLHLLGYDHQTNEQAKIMEQQEILILKQLGFDNPYILKENYLS